MPTTSPTRDAAELPASTAALTAATSPTTNAVTRPLPIFCQPTMVTLAALIMASLASISATSPLVSIMPRASRLLVAIESLQEEKRNFRRPPRDRLGCFGSLEQFHFRRVRQIDRVPLVGVDVHLQPRVGRQANEQILQHRGAAALDAEVHAVTVLDAVVRRVGRADVDMPLVPDHAAREFYHPRRAEQPAAGRIAVVAALSHW